LLFPLKRESTPLSFPVRAGNILHITKLVQVIFVKVKVWLNIKNIFGFFALLLPLLTLYLLYILHLPLLNYSFTKNVIILLVVSPVLEELTFRGLLQDLVLSRTKSLILTVVLVNIAFVLLHLNVNNSIVYLCPIFICGIIFSVIKIYYERIVYPVLLHVYYNLCFILYFKLAY
jgi:membrane protease YdiL (CAAX protease family)